MYPELDAREGNIMHKRAERILVAALAVFVVLGFSAMMFSAVDRDQPLPPERQPRVLPAAMGDPIDLTGAAWFAEIRGYCNPVDVVTRMSWQPAPDTDEGTKYKATCYALAGRIDEARAALLTLPYDEQWRGAGIVFGAGHPAADAGDDLAAGPLMELVVEFWPNHYQALYHAGAAAFERGELELASDYLERFLEEYSVEDGWRRNALAMLAEIG